MKKQQVKKYMQKLSISGELSGRGEDWELIITDLIQYRTFRKTLGRIVGGWSCRVYGDGSHCIRPGSISNSERLAMLNID